MSMSTCQCRDKTRTFILTSMMTGNSIIAFHHVFMITFYVVTFKNFFLLTKLLISLKRHTFNMVILKPWIWWMRRTWRTRRIQRTRRTWRIRRIQHIWSIWRIWRIRILIRI